MTNENGKSRSTDYKPLVLLKRFLADLKRAKRSMLKFVVDGHEASLFLGFIYGWATTLVLLLPMVPIGLIAEEAFGHVEITLVILSPYVIYFYTIMKLAMSLVAEAMWKSFGIYKIFGVEGFPMRRRAILQVERWSE